MNRDGSMSVVSDAPIITSHYYTDDVIPSHQPYYSKRQVHFTPRSRAPRAPRYMQPPRAQAPPRADVLRHDVYPMTDGGPGASRYEDDTLSVISSASDMSEAEMRPSRLSVRRSIALVCAWICLVRNASYFYS